MIIFKKSIYWQYVVNLANKKVWKLWIHMITFMESFLLHGGWAVRIASSVTSRFAPSMQHFSHIAYLLCDHSDHYSDDSRLSRLFERSTCVDVTSECSSFSSRLTFVGVGGPTLQMNASDFNRSTYQYWQHRCYLCIRFYLVLSPLSWPWRMSYHHLCCRSQLFWTSRLKVEQLQINAP